MTKLLGVLVLMAGCGPHAQIVGPSAPTLDDTPAMHDAKAYVSRITDMLPQWVDDPVSEFEGPELLLVEKDLARVGKDKDDPARYLSDVDDLCDAWAVLVALDQVLQRENLA